MSLIKNVGKLQCVSQSCQAKFTYSGYVSATTPAAQKFESWLEIKMKPP
jgi:hypothetical protein